MNSIPEKQRSPDATVQIIATVFVLVVAVGGIFVPEIGLVLAALMVTAIVMTLIKPRSFCSRVCPRGRALGFIMRKPSRRKSLPPFVLSAGFRRLLCGSTMFCVIGSLVRTGGNIHSVGIVFWGLCALSLSAGLVMGFFFKPRAWCAVCPMGTLQDTISQKGK